MHSERPSALTTIATQHVGARLATTALPPLGIPVVITELAEPRRAGTVRSECMQREILTLPHNVCLFVLPSIFLLLLPTACYRNPVQSWLRIWFPSLSNMWVARRRGMFCSHYVNTLSRDNVKQYLTRLYPQMWLSNGVKMRSLEAESSICPIIRWGQYNMRCKTHNTLRGFSNRSIYPCSI